jgi:hypothetical protein
MNITHFFVCICVRASAHVCAWQCRAQACACARVALLIQHATGCYIVICDGLWRHRILRHYLIKGTIFRFYVSPCGICRRPGVILAHMFHVLRVSPVSITPPMFHTHVFIYYCGYINLPLDNAVNLTHFKYTWYTHTHTHTHIRLVVYVTFKRLNQIVHIHSYKQLGFMSIGCAW